MESINHKKFPKEYSKNTGNILIYFLMNLNFVTTGCYCIVEPLIKLADLGISPSEDRNQSTLPTSQACCEDQRGQSISKCLAQSLAHNEYLITYQLLLFLLGGGDQIIRQLYFFSAKNNTKNNTKNNLDSKVQRAQRIQGTYNHYQPLALILVLENPKCSKELLQICLSMATERPRLTIVY